MAVRSLLADPTDALAAHRAVLEDAFDIAVARARAAIDLCEVDVVFYDAAHDAIPEWGVGGCTQSAHLVLVAVDPAHPVARDDVVSTLLHEFHHAMRWRTTTLGDDLGAMLASEGLAVHFEAETLGRAPFYALGALEPGPLALATARLHARPPDTGTWFFGGSPDVPRAFGYALGFRLAGAHADLNGGTARERLATPTDELLALLPTLAS